MAALPEISPRRIGAFRSCGYDAYVEQAVYNPNRFANALSMAHSQTPCTTHRPALDLPQWRVRCTKCHDRFCVPCSNERSWRVRTSLLNHMAARKDLSLIGLTIEHSDAPLAETLDRITRHFRALRLLPIWKKNISGGVAIIETKIAKNGRSWHTHYHIICEAKYVPQDKLSAAWHKITGDSFIVDVRRVGAITGAVQYITKYITKAADQAIVNSPKHLAEAIIAFTGRRLVSTFGTWRGLQLMERPDEEKTINPATTWKPVGRIDEIMHWASKGDPIAIRIMRAIAPGHRRDSG